MSSSALTEKSKKKFDAIAEAIADLSEQLKDWKKDLELNGVNLRVALIKQPSILAYYDQIAVELYACVKHLQSIEKEVRGLVYKKLKEKATRDYTDTAIQRLIDCDVDYVKVHTLLIDVEEVYENCKSIVGAIQQRAYTLNNLVRVYEKELQDITINIGDD